VKSFRSQANQAVSFEKYTYKSLLEAIFMNSRLRVERENNGQRLNRIYLKVIENKNLNFLRKDIGVVSQKSNS